MAALSEYQPSPGSFTQGLSSPGAHTAHTADGPQNTRGRLKHAGCWGGKRPTNCLWTPKNLESPSCHSGSKSDSWSPLCQMKDAQTVVACLLSGRAIKHVKESIFSVEAGARRGIPKVLVVLTDGRSQDDVNKVSKEMQMEGRSPLNTQWSMDSRSGISLWRWRFVVFYISSFSQMLPVLI